MYIIIILFSAPPPKKKNHAYIMNMYRQKADQMVLNSISI